MLSIGGISVKSYTTANTTHSTHLKTKGSSLLLALVGFKQSLKLLAAVLIALSDAFGNEVVYLREREQIQEWEYKLAKSQEQT